MADFIVNDFMDLHSQIDHKSFNTLYRGHGNIEWELIPKAGRPDYAKIGEQKTLDFFKRSSMPYLKLIPQNNWDWLTLAQHYGIATRLLDWTTNPLIAAFFAVEEEHDCDSVMYKYKYRSRNVANLEENDPFTITEVKVIEPFASSERVLRQKGKFTIHPDPKTEFTKPGGGETLERLIIKKGYKSRLRTELRTYGITQFEIYGDIDGLSRYMNWRSKFDKDFTKKLA
jgi:hypothetical protein